ncbi:hypothetical protein HDV04_005756 [Boothiomyces sp. JEL0838]|nr:hypothetical protein HDV04_005756 [Boothiomyces sp. JEL0838]
MIVYNETYAPYYYSLNPVGFCGMQYSPNSDGSGCCASSVDYSQTLGIHSWQTISLINDWTMDNAASMSANQHKYCMIEFHNDTSPGLFYGLERLYILQDYNYFGCTNQEYTIPLDPLGLASNQSDTVKNATVIEFSQAQNFVDWITYVPGEEMIPTNHTAVEIFGLLGFIFSCTSSFMLTLLHIYLYWKWSKRILLAILVLQILSLTSSIAMAYSTFTVFFDPVPLFIVTAVINFTNFSYLASNMVNLYLIFLITNILSEWFKFSLYLCLVAVDIVLIGPQFAIVFVYYLGTYDQYEAMSPITTIMNEISKYLNLVLNLSPIILLLTKIIYQHLINLKKKGTKMTLLSLLYKYKDMLGILMGQIIVSVTFFIVYHLAYATNTLGNDRDVSAIAGVFSALTQISNILIILSFRALREHTKELLKPSAKLNREIAMKASQSCTVPIEATVKMSKSQ